MMTFMDAIMYGPALMTNCASAMLMQFVTQSMLSSCLVIERGIVLRADAQQVGFATLTLQYMAFDDVRYSM